MQKKNPIVLGSYCYHLLLTSATAIFQLLTFKSRILYPVALMLSLYSACTPAHLSAAQNVQVPKFLQNDQQINLTAGSMEILRDSEEVMAYDDVVVTQGELKIRSEFALYSKQRSQLLLHGGLVLKTDQYDLKGDYGLFNTANFTGEIGNGYLFVPTGHYHIRGRYIDRLADKRYRISMGSFTTCDCEEGKSPLWSFTASRLNFVADEKVNAYHIAFRIKQVPVMYLPYITIPVNTERKSGFLTPDLSYSKLEGIKIKQDLFWAFSPSQDVTFFAESRQKKGLGGGLEYRYVLSRKSRGHVEAGFFNDTALDSKRWFASMLHTQQVTERKNFKVDAHYINDTAIFVSQEDDQIEDRVSQSIESNLFYTDRGDISSSYLLSRYSESLTSDNESTLQKLPEFKHQVINYKIDEIPVYVGTHVLLDNYWREEGIDGERIDMKADIKAKIKPFFLESSVRDTFYHMGDDTGKESQNRIVYYFASKSGISFYRDFGVVRHTTTHSVKYEYIPAPSRKNIHYFDDLESIVKKNSITVTWMNIFMAKDKSEETSKDILMMNIYESFNLQGGYAPSDIRFEASYSGDKDLLLDADFTINPRQSSFTSYNASARYLYKKAVINTGIRNTRRGFFSERGDIYNPFSLGESTQHSFGDDQNLRFLTWNLQLNLLDSLIIKNNAYYDIQSRTYHEIRYAAFFSFQCWELVVSYADLPAKNQISLMLNLKGIGSMESAEIL